MHDQQLTKHLFRPLRRESLQVSVVLDVDWLAVVLRGCFDEANLVVVAQNLINPIRLQYRRPRGREHLLVLHCLMTVCKHGC